MLTDAECINIIKKLASKHGIKPAEITTKLMTEKDKQDMREGKLDFEALEAHVRVWKELDLRTML